MKRENLRATIQEAFVNSVKLQEIWARIYGENKYCDMLRMRSLLRVSVEGLLAN